MILGFFGVLVLCTHAVFTLDTASFEALQNLDPFLIWQSAADSESKCAEDMAQSIDDLKSGQGYALQMLDSCAKPPSGLLLGNHFFFGQYDECLDVRNPNGNFDGRYCLLGLIFKNVSNLPLSYTYAMCVPSTCTSQDLNPILAAGTSKLPFLLAAADVNCKASNDEVQLSDGAWGVLSLIIILVVFAVFSTIYEIYQRFYKKNEKPHQLLSAFSIYQNGKALFEVRDGGAGQMDCLHGLRSIFMLWVVLCHDAMTIATGPIDNAIEMLKRMNTDSSLITTQNGYLSVDSFFFLSGLLVAFVFFRDIGKNGSYDVPRSFITRYVRLTPPYAMMILMQMYLVKLMGDGPIWNGMMNGPVKNCNDYWWSSLLYIQNLVNPNSLCLVQSWYIAADMQMYWMAPIFLYAMLFWPIPGGIFTVVMCIASSFWTFGIALAYELPWAAFLSTSGDVNRMDNYPFWSHMSPWLVGMILGYVICGLKAKKIKVRMPFIVAVAGWIIGFCLLLGSFLGLIWFIDHPENTAMQRAAFISFHRLGWALGLAWVVFACIHGYGSFINVFLSWSPFQVIGKLSFSMYLVHISIIYAVFGSSRTLIHTDLKEQWLTFFSIFVASNILAIPLALLVEMPTGVFDRYFLRSLKVFPYPKPKPKREKPVEKEVAVDIEPKEQTSIEALPLGDSAVKSVSEQDGSEPKEDDIETKELPEVFNPLTLEGIVPKEAQDECDQRSNEENESTKIEN